MSKLTLQATAESIQRAITHLEQIVLAATNHLTNIWTRHLEPKCVSILRQHTLDTVIRKCLEINHDFPWLVLILLVIDSTLSIHIAAKAIQLVLLGQGQSMVASTLHVDDSLMLKGCHSLWLVLLVVVAMTQLSLVGGGVRATPGEEVPILVHDSGVFLTTGDLSDLQAD